MAFVTRIFGLCCTLAIVVPLAAVAPVTAETTDDVAKFYRGKTVNAVVGYGPGSTFELYLRILTRHIGRHIPGNPTVVLQQMPGAGSLKATNYLAAVAPKDGSVFGMINPVNTIEPLIDPKNSRFDPRTFQWLGSLNSEISTCGFWNKDIRTLDDLKKREIVFGSTGPASGSTVDAKMLGALVGLKIRVVTGYPTLNDIRLAAERGETDGFCGLLVSALKTDYWDQYKSGRVTVPVQMKAGTLRWPHTLRLLSHRFEMRVAALVEVVVCVTHGLRLAASEHHLEVHGLKRVVLIAVNDAGRA